jgi:hypothetical protein
MPTLFVHPAPVQCFFFTLLAFNVLFFCMPRIDNVHQCGMRAKSGHLAPLERI